MVYDRLFDITKNTFAGNAERLEFKVYGSMATKLAIDTSDMDISLHGVIEQEILASSDNPREITVEHMERIHRRFDALEWVETNNLLDKATVPVIKLVVNLEKLAKLEKMDPNIFAENPTVNKHLKIDLIFNDILKTSTNSITGESFTIEGDSQST
jgi:DNA polymerase sigma